MHETRPSIHYHHIWIAASFIRRSLLTQIIGQDLRLVKSSVNKAIGNSLVMTTTNGLGHPPTSRDYIFQDVKEEAKPGNIELTSEDVVEFTSRLIAAARAYESRREDGLFQDPYAELLAGHEAMQEFAENGLSSRGAGNEGLSKVPPASGEEPPHKVLSPGFQPIVESRILSIRTCFCDDFFDDCTGPRGIKQVVSLGAGMDTRALRRKAAAGTKVFEVDKSVVLRVKRDLLSRRGPNVMLDGNDIGFAEVIDIGADLSVDGWQGKLLDAGFDPKCPSAWLVEGLTMYIEESGVRAIFRAIHDFCSPGSAVLATFIDAELATVGGISSKDLMGTLKFGTDDPEGFMREEFPDSWSFKSLLCGTPGAYPNGADYGVGFADTAAPMVFGFSKPEELVGGKS